MKANGIHPSGGPTTPTPVPSNTRSTQRDDTRYSEVSRRKRKLSDTNTGKPRNDATDGQGQEAKQRPKSKPEPTQDMSWKPNPQSGWRPKQETSWRPLHAPRWEPTYAYQQYPQVRPEYDYPPRSMNVGYHQPMMQQQPQQLPLASRYVMQTDANGNNSLLLNNQYDSIFNDVSNGDIFDPMQFGPHPGPFKDPLITPDPLETGPSQSMQDVTQGNNVAGSQPSGNTPRQEKCASPPGGADRPISTQGNDIAHQTQQSLYKQAAESNKGPVSIVITD